MKFIQEDKGVVVSSEDFGKKLRHDDGEDCNDQNPNTLFDKYLNNQCKGTILPGNVFFVAPDGSDSNDGSYNSPFATLTNIPSSAYAVFKDGNYDTSYRRSSYVEALNVFRGLKNGHKLISENYLGANLVIRQRIGNARDEVVMPPSHDVQMINFAVDHGLYQSASHEVSLFNWTTRGQYHNVVFTIRGRYSYVYHNGQSSSARPTMFGVVINGGSRMPNASGTHIYNSTSQYSKNNFLTVLGIN